MVTEDRQLRNRGLSHIEDGAYEFFLEAEVLRVNFLNDNKLAEHYGDLVSHTNDAIKEDLNLKEKWLACFPQKEIEPGLEIKKNLAAICDWLRKFSRKFTNFKSECTGKSSKGRPQSKT